MIRTVTCRVLLPLILSVLPLKASDSFSSATTLSGTVASNTQTNQNATSEAGEPTYGINSTKFRTLWWKWTAPSSGRVTIDLAGSAEYPVTNPNSAFGKYLGVWVPKTTTASVGSLALINATTGTQPFISFPVASGTTYYFHVSSDTSTEYGSITMNVVLDTGTDINQLTIQNQGLFINDSFANRAPLTGVNASSIAYNMSATTESGEPSIGYKTMWWNWTAPQSGRVTIHTNSSDGATWEKNLAVFLGDSLLNLQLILFRSNQALPTTTFPVTAGQVYQIALASTNQSEGGSAVISLSLATNTDINQLNIGTPAAASNNMFGNRVTLYGANVSAIGYGEYATVESLEPVNAGFATMWWTYTAPAAGTVSIAANGSASNKYLTVWTGGSLATLSQVIRSTTAVSPSVSFSAVAGQTYHVSVGATSSSNNPGHVVLTLAGPPVADAPVAGLVIERAIRLRWPTTPGVSYRVRSSPDLQNWSNVGPVIIGDGTNKESFHPVTETSEFFNIFPQ